MFNTSNSTDTAPNNTFPFLCKPDCTIYHRNRCPQEGLNSFLAEFIIEFKTTGNQDPFRHDQDPKADTKGSDMAGQVIAYAAMLLDTQYRTHAFSILIIKDYAQLIYWDCGGAVVTEPIFYNTAPHLFNFFVHYDHTSKEVHGHNPTIGLPTNAEERAA